MRFQLCIRGLAVEGSLCQDEVCSKKQVIVMSLRVYYIRVDLSGLSCKISKTIKNA